jgi:hypothetical protein
MEKEQKAIEVNPYAVLATNLKLTVFKKDPLIFIDPEGKKWILTDYGFTPSEAFSIREEFSPNGALFRKKQEELDSLIKKYRTLKEEVKIFQETGEDLISRRSRKKIKQILASDISDTEKVLKLREYFIKEDDI